MTIQSVLLPLFVEVILTFVLLFSMVSARMRAFREGLDWHTVANREPNWPARPTQLSNAFSNQFELPVLFYVLTILAWITKEADLLFVVMAWIFVLCRIGQAVVHVTSNHAPTRGMIYGIGGLVLVLMWIIFMARILLAL
jgi:hypothetical protein